MDHLATLRVFRRVAETLNFTRVARELGLSQPAVSRAVADLEQRLGATLVRRTTRAMTLTEAGARFRDRVGALIDDLDAAESEARGAEAALVGQVRVQAPLSWGRSVLVGKLAGFLARHPHVRVDLMLSDSMVDLVAEGCDLAVRIGDLEDSTLKARRIGQTRRAPFASPAYLARAGDPATPADLAQHNCLIFTRLRDPERWRFIGDGGEVHVDVRGNFRADSLEALREAALEGLGLALGPCWLVAEDFAAGRLRPVLVDWRTPATPIHAVWPASRTLGAKTRALLDYLAEDQPRARPT